MLGKFRLWDNEKQMMIDPRRKGISLSCTGRLCHEAIRSDILMNRYVIMFGSDTLDKNKKEIFDRDIVAPIVDGVIRKDLAKVVKYEDMSFWAAINEEQCGGRSFDELIERDRIVIIGNAYENRIIEDNYFDPD